LGASTHAHPIAVLSPRIYTQVISRGQQLSEDKSSDVQWTVHPKGVSPPKGWVEATRRRRVQYLQIKRARAVVKGDTLSVQVSGLKTHVEPFVVTIVGSLFAWWMWSDGSREDIFNAAVTIALFVILWVGFFVRGLTRGFANQFIIVDRHSRTLSLPWWSLTFSLDHVLGFELVKVVPTSATFGGLELYILVNRNDLPMRYFIARYPDTSTLKALLRFTGLPLDEYDPGNGVEVTPDGCVSSEEGQ
jgi:hypothetical protein